MRAPTFLLAGARSSPTPIPACSVRFRALIVAQSCDGVRIRRSDTRLLEKSLLGTGYPYKQDSDSDLLDAYMEMLKAAMRATSGVRRPGAAALDLAYVAAGRLDGFWEIGLKMWDVAAGVLMIQECGGLVTDLAGRDGWQQSGNIVAGNPKIHEALLQLIEPHLTQELRK